MDIHSLSKFITDNMVYIVGLQLVVMTIMLIIIINASWKLSYMRKRYRKMMTGVDGANLERMLIGHIDETKEVSAENKRLQTQIHEIDDLLQTAITRVGIMRFRAFDDMGSDLSYSVAMLDSHNNGVILSSIFGRDVSRSYAKPIKDGVSTYTLTEEEGQALKEAMQR